MRTKPETKFYLILNGGGGSERSISNGYDSIDKLVDATDCEPATYRVIVGHEETLTVERKTIATIGTPEKRTAPATKKDGTPRKKPGRKSTAEKLASKTENLVEHVVEARNGKRTGCEVVGEGFFNNDQS